MALSVAIALLIVWIAIAASYETNYPVGFFVGAPVRSPTRIGRGWAAWIAGPGAPACCRNVRSGARNGLATGGLPS